jgi:hypothetical protein
MTAELEALKKRVEELEAAKKPPEPFVPEPWQPIDYTANFGTPANAVLDLINAVPDSLVRALVSDARRPNPVTGFKPQPTQQQQQRGSGWVDERPIEPPPGIEHCDRLMDVQDALDRAEVVGRIANAAAALSRPVTDAPTVKDSTAKEGK